MTEDKGKEKDYSLLSVQPKDGFIEIHGAGKFGEEKLVLSNTKALLLFYALKEILNIDDYETHE